MWRPTMWKGLTKKIRWKFCLVRLQNLGNWDNNDGCSLCNKFPSYFKFREKFLSHIMGLPMGTILSPYLANFYMDFIEQSALNSFSLKHSLWIRFVDDILFVWENGQDSLKVFLAHLNTFDSSIQLTTELKDAEKLPFLDVSIIKNTPSLELSIYRKPTHNEQNLHFSSNNPPSVKRG